jgi:hypothetical protein
MKIAFLGNFRVDYTSETHHAKSLEQLGHTVERLQETQTHAGHIADIQADVFVWVHTHGWHTPGDISQALARLRERRIPTLTYHLDLWRGLRRQSDIRNSPYWELDHFCTVDKLMADWLSENTPVRGHFIPAGVFGGDCYISDQPSKFANDVVFVGSRRYHPEWPWRPKLIDWLKHTYGDRFTHIGPDGITSLRGHELNAMYSRSLVAVGDTLCQDFTYPYYTSDRYFEAPGRGGFQIFPAIPGTDWLDMPRFTFGDFDELKDLIDHYVAHDEEREAMRRSVHEQVKQAHTYRHRWETILGAL